MSNCRECKRPALKNYDLCMVCAEKKAYYREYRNMKQQGVKLLWEKCAKCGQRGLWQKFNVQDWQGNYKNFTTVNGKKQHKECPPIEIKEVPQVITIDLIRSLRVRGHYDEAQKTLEAYHASRKAQKIIYEKELRNRDSQIRRIVLTTRHLCIVCGKEEVDTDGVQKKCETCKTKERSRFWIKKVKYKKGKKNDRRKTKEEKRKTKDEKGKAQ